MAVAIRGPLYLIGFMGTGKTTIGRRVAGELKWRFVDLDYEVERASGLSIPQIFERHGEAHFRDLETEQLRRTVKHPTSVVATGGGTFTLERNVELIRDAGTSLWIDVPAEQILLRLSRSPRGRPLYQSADQARALLAQRRPAYRRADLRIEVTDHDRPRDVASRIVELLRGGGGPSAVPPVE